MKDFIERIIRDAGDAVMAYFGDADVIATKETASDIVTVADMASQEVILKQIREAYPEHGIVSEEYPVHEIDAEYIWHIDPLDGTKNFASRVPIFGINIALAHRGVLQSAAMYFPATGELCYAEAGKGATLNGRSMICSEKREWKGTYGLMGLVGYDSRYPPFHAELNERAKGTAWANAIGCPAMCGLWVADGRRDWYIGPFDKSWDYAAPALIAQEAGCTVSNFLGTTWKPGDRGLVIANRFLFPELLETVQEYLL